MSSKRAALPLLFIGFVGLAASLACSSEPPSQPIQFANGILNMSIAQDWMLQQDTGKHALYTYPGMEGVKLSFVNQTENWGTPMTVNSVRSAIGTELNLRYKGSVTARMGLGGCAVLSYPYKIEEPGRTVYTENWVVAHPYGYGAVARVAITLEVPDGQQATPEFQAIVDLLDKQVGDAKMPEA